MVECEVGRVDQWFVHPVVELQVVVVQQNFVFDKRYQGLLQCLLHTHSHTCRLVDGTSMNEECIAVNACLLYTSDAADE